MNKHIKFTLSAMILEFILIAFLYSFVKESGILVVLEFLFYFGVGGIAGLCLMNVIKYLVK